ncbi:SDR family NAD(P)-dependent oxidoreductase [Ilumatobacter coccineus]|uniref:Putative oxidoreductase n=1 Tax=Ilumatobacter coccineus (strain NBRC 103263 / KCTC 29153 / YM16-304) TaxID=1313172 RepID=A0A6C7EAT8_ILUCY|nr:SDR family NAD(P)-dependent oxidoreductase [Ilumatobacter coccineus]BAN03122.1 putative oxidoreductase [Ilumatobacter coccineus YM16-304]
MQELDGKTAVITGAASGIGLALAERFGSAGMKLVLADVDAGPLDTVTADFASRGHEVTSFVVDVRDLDQIRALNEHAKATFGKVHLLCNNAGVGSGGLVAAEDDLDLWKWTIDVNLWGVIYGCKVFLPDMIAHGESAHIVNTASMAGLASAPLMGPYNISKYGVVALSETMLQEMFMMKTSVGVSVLCPAFVQTGIADSRRNLPADVRPGDHAIREPEPLASPIKQLVANGLPTDVVAEAVHDAVVDEQFWILTHPETKPSVLERAERIVSQTNPPAYDGFG